MQHPSENLEWTYLYDEKHANSNSGAQRQA